MSRFSVSPARAYVDKRLTTRDLSILGCIGIYTSREGWCFPSQGHIGEMLGISQQAVHKSVKRLCANGYLIIEPTYRLDGGRSSNRMRVVMDAENPPECERVGDILQQRNPTPTTSEVVAPTTSEVVAPTTSEVVVKPPSKAPNEKEVPARQAAPSDGVGEGKKPKPKGATFQAWINSLPEDTVAIPPDHHVFRYAKQVGLPDYMLRLAWSWFEQKYRNSRKRYSDWPLVFRNSVEGNWGRIWYIKGDEYELSTVGRQFERSQGNT